MFNGQYKKLDGILREIRKYPFTEEATKRELAHSLVSLLRLVGATVPLERKYANLKIDMHKGELPKDIIYLHGVNNKGNSCANKGIAMRYASDIYNSALHSEEAKAVKNGTSITTPEQVSQIYPPTLPTDPEEVILWNELVAAPIKYKADRKELVFENSYSINGMSIDTSFPYGFVELAYDAVKVDDEGFPMIPDDESFAKALRYFYLKEAAEPAFYRGDVQQYVYNDINKQYEWYVGQAFSSLMMLSPDQMESLASGLIRIIPSYHNYRDGFKSFNKPE